MKLRWAGTCASCDTALAARTTAYWDSSAKTATCLNCQPVSSSVEVVGEPLDPEPLARGTAGASARREYQKRSARETARKQQRVDEDAKWRERAKTEHPIIGRLASALTPKPTITPESHMTRNWDVGAVGEERVGAMLELCPDLVVIHDRKVPNSKANIDHVVVAPAGIFIVDPKRYTGEVQKRDVGSLFRPDMRLYVGRRDCSKLVAGARWQAEQLRKTLGDRHQEVPIFMALCFVDSEWGSLAARSGSTVYGLAGRKLYGIS